MDSIKQSNTAQLVRQSVTKCLVDDEGGHCSSCHLNIIHQYHQYQRVLFIISSYYFINIINIKGYSSVFIISSCYLSISLISRGTVPNIIFLFTNIFDIKGKCSPFSPFINSSRKFCPILAIPFSRHLLFASFWGVWMIVVHFIIPVPFATIAKCCHIWRLCLQNQSVILLFFQVCLLLLQDFDTNSCPLR